MAELDGLNNLKWFLPWLGLQINTVKQLSSHFVQIPFFLQLLCVHWSRVPFLAIWDALAFCSTLGMRKPNSVNDKKGWPAHPNHLMPGAHKPQAIRPYCVLFATSNATKTQWRVRSFYKLSSQNVGVLVKKHCPSNGLNPALQLTLTFAPPPTKSLLPA